MLDEIKVNLLDLIFSNTKDLGVNTDAKVAANANTTAPKVDKDQDSFAKVMDNLQGKTERPTQERDTKSQNKFDIKDDKKVEAKEAVSTVKKVSKEIKDKISNDGKETKSVNETEDETEDDEETVKELQINFLVLNTMKQQVDVEIEDLTKAISSLDLSSPEGIDAILNLSDKLDALRSVEAEVISQIEDLHLPSELELNLDEIEVTSDDSTTLMLNDSDLPAIEIELEEFDTKKLETLIQNKIKDLVEHKVAENKQATKPELSLGEDLKPSIETLTNNLKNINELKTNNKKQDTQDTSDLPINLAKMKDVEIKEIKVERAPIDASVAKNLRSQERLFMDETSEPTVESTEKQTETEIAVVASGESSFSSEMSDMEADSFNSNPAPQEPIIIPGQVRDTEIFKVNSKIQIHKTPVSINELPNLVSREVGKIIPGGKQEITMSLTPGDLGQIDLSISRSANNKIEIKMVFSQDNAMNTVEHKLTELRAILRSRGFEANIELSKSESSNTETYNQTKNDSFNEAREEQKDRILDTLPEWLRPDESSISTSFESTLNGIL